MRSAAQMIFLAVLCLGILPKAHAAPVHPEGLVTERVMARGFVRCGGVPRPGLAQADGHGRWSGLEVDVCRAIAAAALGSPDRMKFHGYETPGQFAAVRGQRDDVFFLTGSEMNDNGLAGRIVPGPVIFVESHNVMVPADSAVRHVSGLAGDPICFFSGSGAERSLEDYFDRIHKGFFLPMPFSEHGEMDDAYDVQRCSAIAGEITTLAATRLAGGVNQMRSRILREPLSAFPILAAAGTEDAQWSAIVAWTVITLLSADRPETRWYAAGAGAMPVKAAELGLEKGWQRRVLSSVGSYGDIFERDLGKKSPFKLRRGLNANQAMGGLLFAPFRD